MTPQTASRPITRLLPGIVLSVLIILCPASFIRSQDAPVAGQPTSDFYGARGNGVKVAWSLDRTTVPEDGVIVATLIVTGADNPAQITRPDLKQLPQFQKRFTITNNPDPPPAPDAKEVRFTYQLRPRNRAVDQVPTLEFRYFKRAGGDGKQYQTTRAWFVPITVTEPAPQAEPPAIPLGEPDHLFAITTGPAVLRKPTLTLGWWTWLAVALLPPVLAVMWYLGWRQMFPGAAQLAHLRRSRAARRAVDAIRRATRTADPAGATAAAVLDYLRTRFPLPPGAVTPSEVRDALVEFGLQPDDTAAVTALLRRCDAARFAPAADACTSLEADATAIVTRLEAA